MKQINQLIHLTKSKDVLKSILLNGFYTSYARETFGDQNILIPMISFANILFRDIGQNEVVDYGKYGIVFERDYAIDTFGLNPVIYVKNNSEIDKIFSYNFQTSIIPQILPQAKKFYSDSNCGKFSKHISINPISDEILSLLDTLDKGVNDNFIDSIKTIFENYYINTLKQILLLKPFRVENKFNEIKIAYNEREWRKSFFELHYITEINPDGTENEKYKQILKTDKPHFTKDYVQKIDNKNIKCIYVENYEEVYELTEYINEKLNMNINVHTLDFLVKNENQ